MLNQVSVAQDVRDWVSKQLFDCVPSNILVIDREYRVVLSNESFRRLFGASEGRHCYEIYQRRDTPCPSCKVAQCFSDGRAYTTDQSGYDREGCPAHYVVQIAPIHDNAGQVTHVVEIVHDATATREIEWSYNLLFDRVPCFITVLNRNLQVVRANDLVRRVFGQTINDHCYRLYKHRDSACEDCPALKSFEDGQMHTAKQVGLDKNGARTCFVVSTAPLAANGHPPEFVIEMALDITGQEKLASELVRESRFRHLLTETAMDPVIATDIADLVTIFNPAAERLFDRSAADTIGKLTGESILPPEYLQLLRGPGNTLEVQETYAVARSGEAIPVRFCGTVLRQGSEVVGSAVFLADQRERKKLEKERLDNERLAAVGQTVSQLAHGIKNILTGIQGGMYALKTGLKRDSKERIEKGWLRLERNVNRITELVKGFLSFSRGHTPNVAPVDAAALVQGVFALFEDSARKNGVELRVDVAEGLRPANLDAEDLRVCLENLVSNAMDACLVSESADKHILLRLFERDDKLYFEVADNGCGMDYEVKKKVFTTFFTTKGLGGTGLGLLVTRKIVQDHGGIISVTSEPGKGSMFGIELPRARLPEPSEPSTNQHVS